MPERIVSILLGRDSYHKRSVNAAFCRALDSLEHYHSADVDAYLQTGRLLLKRFNANPREIRRRLYALELREGRIARSETPSDDIDFMRKAWEWKYRCAHSPNGALDRKQYMRISDAFHYPDFISILKEDKKLCDQFFQWTVDDRCDPRIFIEYPALAAKITESNFAFRVGKYDLIGLQRGSLYLRGEAGEDLDLRNPQAKMALSRGLTVDFATICEQFRDKDIRIGTLEACSYGICNWSPAHLGRWSPYSQSFEVIDLNKEDWWDQLHPDEVLSAEQLQEQYKLKMLPNGKEWVFLLIAASESSEHVLVGGTHGYLAACIPNSKGSYGVFPFGKYAKGEFPTTLWEKLKIVFNYCTGTIVYPDQNIALSMRDSEYLAKTTSEEVGKQIMDDIRADIIHSFKDEMPFQLFQDNCMFWAQHKLDRLLTEEEKRLSFIHPPHSKMTGLWRFATGAYNLFPRAITTPIFNLIACVFGAHLPYSWRTRDGEARVSHYLDRAPWAAERYEFPNPSALLLRRRSRQACSY